ncbi:hypothetical protein [Psychroflexus salis]|uniref:Uncharacterized protein n=1 Tax=Psychroflexus salis TaxID=1526574 RepID=A0A916ZWG8_9FLAO|nr:hypothetical protein [Psychroflexus salis]GGE16267.1 hypothetical protein GCM10010831_16960 [Psychroflexus salis]
MKHLIYILVLLTGFISSAQNEILMEHIWELEYIELDGETLYQPENEESNTTINLEIGQSFYNPGTFFKEHNLICEEFICGPIEFTSATMFNFLFCELSLEGCNIDGNILFQSNYMMVFQDLM